MSNRCLAGALLMFWSATACPAQTPAEFFRGKSIEVYVGFGAGGVYDVYARLLSRFMGKYIPGTPALVPKNMDGAGSLRLANHLYNAAPRDGTTFGTISRGTGFEALFGNTTAQFDGTKFNWIGSASNEVSVCYAWHTSGIAKFEDLLTRAQIVGASGRSADSYQFPKIANSVLGTNFKIVTGYRGGNDIDLAIERGEVQGRCGASWTSLRALHPTWLSERKVNIFFQMGLSKHSDLPDVPLIIDLAKTDEARTILRLVFSRQVMAWPFLLPPGVPADRIEVLRQAFLNTMQDKDFLAEADKAKIEIAPVSGAEVQKLVQEIYATPPDIVRKTAEFLQ